MSAYNSAFLFMTALLVIGLVGIWFAFLPYVEAQRKDHEKRYAELEERRKLLQERKKK